VKINLGLDDYLGIDQMYWDGTVRKMKIDPKILNFIRPHQVMAVLMKSRSETGPRFLMMQCHG
jgi:hypothetical protein